MLRHNGCQFTQRLIQRHKVYAGISTETVSFANGYFVLRAAALGGMVLAGVVYQNISHHGCRQPEELGATLQVDLMLIDEPKIGFVDQSRWLECVIMILTTEITTSQPAKFVID